MQSEQIVTAGAQAATERRDGARQRWVAELRFMRTLLAMNLASAMEYRASFVTQIVFMFINNGIYLLFWLIFFDQFGAVRGYNINEIYLLFAVVALGFGLAMVLAGNTGPELAYLIAQGRLDYYLVMPRTLLTHVICSRMAIAALGDISFGLLIFFFAGQTGLGDVAFFLAAIVPVTLIFMAFMTMAGSLAFFMGNAQYASRQMMGAILTFSLYPNTLFTGLARFLLFTLIPAGFVGAVPVMIIKDHNLLLLGVLVLVAVVFWLLAVGLFYRGLRRYESGSALNVNV